MRTSQTFGVFFTIKKEKAKDGKTPVYACVTVAKEKCYFALKQTVEVSKWDYGKGCIKGTKDETKDGNAYLDEIKLALHGHYKDLQLKGRLITPQMIKSVFLGEITTDDVYPLSRLIAYHFETAKTSLKWSTLKHYEVTERYLKKFIKEKLFVEDLFIHEVNYKFIIDFETYLRNHKPVDHQKPLNNNGVMKHLIRLRKMTSLAVKLEWLNSDPFKNYKFKYKRVEKDFLSDKELLKLEKENFGIDRLIMVRDMFVFSCYTGLSFVDLMNLKADQHFVIGVDRDKWIKTFRQKSDEPVHIPLLPAAKAIIKRYEKNIRSLANGTVFPPISNQKVNLYLKEIARDCGIKKELTFHVARHTFATTVTLSNGVPIETVSKMMGHTKIATTQIYARVLEKKISQDMGKLKRKMLGESIKQS